MIDKVVVGLIACFIIFVAGIFLYVIPKAADRERRAEQATEPGCELIGNAKNLGSVFFYDCNGEIKLKRIK